jgi:hypothetical protein
MPAYFNEPNARRYQASSKKALRSFKQLGRPGHVLVDSKCIMAASYFIIVGARLLVRLREDIHPDIERGWCTETWAQVVAEHVPAMRGRCRRKLVARATHIMTGKVRAHVQRRQKRVGAH